MDALIDSIHFLSLLVYLVAFLAMTQFWYRVRHVTFFFLTLHEFFEILNDNFGYHIFGLSVEIFAEISEIIGAIVLTYSVYYLIKELGKINAIESFDEKE